MAKIFLLMGKSSTGKDTVFNQLIEDCSLGLKTIVGYTTRPIREKEKEGKEYHFVDDMEMYSLEEAGKVIERRTYKTVYGEWHYFIVDDGQINLKKNDYLVIGTLESYEKIRDYFGVENVVPIYIDTDDGDRLERALKRERNQKQPKYTEMCRRFLADQADFSEENLQRLNVNKRYINKDLDECIDEIKSEIRRNQ